MVPLETGAVITLCIPAVTLSQEAPHTPHLVIGRNKTRRSDILLIAIFIDIFEQSFPQFQVLIGALILARPNIE